jgi:hypothetical protein
VTANLPPQIDNLGGSPDHWRVDLVNKNNLTISKTTAILSFSLPANIMPTRRWDMEYRYIKKKGWVLVTIAYDSIGTPRRSDFGFYPRKNSTMPGRRWDGDFVRWFNHTKKAVAAIRAQSPQPR